MARTPDERLETLGGKKKLSPRELEFMQFIWDYSTGISSEEIYAHFSQNRSTKSTVLANLSKNGYVQNRQEGLHHIYTPLVERVEYEKALVHQQLKELWGNCSFEKLVAAFCGKENLTEKQCEKIQELLEELENDAEIGEPLD